MSNVCQCTANIQIKNAECYAPECYVPDIRYKYKWKMPDIAHQLKVECTAQWAHWGSPDKAVVNLNCGVTTAEVHQAVRLRVYRYTSGPITKCMNSWLKWLRRFVACLNARSSLGAVPSGNIFHYKETWLLQRKKTHGYYIKMDLAPHWLLEEFLGALCLVRVTGRSIKQKQNKLLLFWCFSWVFQATFSGFLLTKMEDWEATDK